MLTPACLQDLDAFARSIVSTSSWRAYLSFDIAGSHRDGERAKP